METKSWYAMTPQERINEPGEEPDCPFCHNPRVMRSDYTRCNRCGVNWLHSEMSLPNYLNVDPRVARRAAANAVAGNQTQLTADRQAGSAEDFMIPAIP